MSSFYEDDLTAYISSTQNPITSPAIQKQKREIPLHLEAAFRELTLALEQSKEEPIFTLQQVQFEWPSQLIQMVCHNNILIMALSNGQLLRIDLARPEVVQSIEIPKKSNDDGIYKIFLDYSGQHLLVNMMTGDTHYYYYKWKKPKLLSKVKNHLFDHIAFSKPHHQSHQSTGIMLLSTMKGQIFELELEPSDDYFKREEKYFRLVYQLGEKLTGLYFDWLDTSSVFVLMTTQNRIYSFSGTLLDTFEPIFEKYQLNPSYQELPGHLGWGQLSVMSEVFEDYIGISKSFAWLTAAGVYYGDLTTSSSAQSIIENVLILPFPAVPSFENENELLVVPPQSIALTGFHILLLYKDRIRAVCRLNDETVWDEQLPEHYDWCQLIQDDVRNTFWLVTEKILFEIVIQRENRNIWKLYLEKKQFQSALENTQHPLERDQIHTKQAEYYFNQKKYQLSATYFGQSSLPIEEVALKFMDLKDDLLSGQLALKVYLETKLTYLSEEDQTQQVLLHTWLLDIYLKLQETLQNDKQQLEQHQQQFTKWLQLEKTRKFLDKQTAYQLFESFGRMDDLIQYANLMLDYEKVLSHYIHQQKYEEALQILSKQNNLDNYYKYGPVLMQHVPVQTVNLWIRMTKLNPKSLLPSLLRYQPSGNEPNQAIRYLEFCIHQLGNTDPSISHFLLNQYCQSDQYEDRLLNFLRGEKYFDLQYALRVCRQYHRLHACVVIYGALGLYQEAVELALQYEDLELAQIYAEQLEEGDPLRKRLWLLIVQYIIQKGDYQKALEIMQKVDCLKIEDLLHYFPQELPFKTFREELCLTLQEYQTKVIQLREQMEDSIQSSELLRLDLLKLSKRRHLIQQSTKCLLCQQSLLLRPFYLFPCLHDFHKNCLLAEWMLNHSNTEVKRVIYLQERIGKALSKEEKLRFEKQLDACLGSECIQCGLFMIQSIDLPFIQAEEEEIIQSWQLR